MPLFHPTVATTTTSSAAISATATSTAPVSSSVAKSTAATLWAARSIRTTSSSASLSTTTRSSSSRSSSSTRTSIATTETSISKSSTSTRASSVSSSRQVTPSKKAPNHPPSRSRAAPRQRADSAFSPVSGDGDIDSTTLTIPCGDTRAELLQLLAFVKSVTLQDRKNIKRVELIVDPYRIDLFATEIDEACAESLDVFNLHIRALLRLGLRKEQIWLNCFVWASGGEAVPSAEDYWEGKEEVAEQVWLGLQEMEDIAFGWDEF